MSLTEYKIILYSFLFTDILYKYKKYLIRMKYSHIYMLFYKNFFYKNHEARIAQSILLPFAITKIFINMNSKPHDFKNLRITRLTKK